MSTPPEASPELAQLLRGAGLAWVQRIRQRALPEHIARLLRRQELWPPGIHGLSLVRRQRLPLVSAEPLADLARLLPGERPPLERELPLAQVLPPSLAGLGEELAAGGETALAEGTAGLSALRQGAEGVAQSTMARVRQALQRAEGAVSPRSTGLASAAQRAVERARQVAGQVQVPRGARLVEELPAALRPLAQGAVERAQEVAAALPSLAENLPERLTSLVGEALPEQPEALAGAAREALGETAAIPEAIQGTLGETALPEHLQGALPSSAALGRLVEGELPSIPHGMTPSSLLRQRVAGLVQRASEALRRRLPPGVTELWRRIRGERPAPAVPEAPQAPGQAGPAVAEAPAEGAPVSPVEVLTQVAREALPEAEAPLAGVAREMSSRGGEVESAEAPLAGVAPILERGRELIAPLERQAEAAIQRVAERLQGAVEPLVPQGVMARTVEAARGLWPRAREALARWLAPGERERPARAEVGPSVPPPGPPAPPAEGAPGAPTAQPPLRAPWQALATRGAELLGLGEGEAPLEEAEERSPSAEEALAAPPAEESWPLQGIPLGEALFGRGPGEAAPAEAGELASTWVSSLVERAAPGLRRAIPALQVRPARRGAEGAPQREEREEGEAPRPGPAEGGGLDLDELAEQVYRRIRERLRVERERSGPLR